MERICEPPTKLSLSARVRTCRTCAGPGSGRVCQRGDDAITSRRLQSYHPQGTFRRSASSRCFAGSQLECQGHLSCFSAMTHSMPLLPQPVAMKLRICCSRGEQFCGLPGFRLVQGARFRELSMEPLTNNATIMTHLRTKQKRFIRFIQHHTQKATPCHVLTIPMWKSCAPQNVGSRVSY